MYLGRIVERADIDTIFYNPKHPYTKALLKSVPIMGRRAVHKRLASIKGTVPVPINLQDSCRFMPRCPDYMSGICDGEEPDLIEVDKEHEVRCYQYHNESTHSV